MSPTQRSIKLMKERGYLVEKTEHWNPFAKVRHDLFNFCDVLAIRKDETVAVQATSASNTSARIAKILSLQSASLWLESPNRRILVHGWAKGKQGVKEIEVTGKPQ